jgi:hypothetical protein
LSTGFSLKIGYPGYPEHPVLKSSFSQAKDCHFGGYSYTMLYYIFRHIDSHPSPILHLTILLTTEVVCWDLFHGVPNPPNWIILTCLVSCKNRLIRSPATVNVTYPKKQCCLSNLKLEHEQCKMINFINLYQLCFFP